MSEMLHHEKHVIPLDLLRAAYAEGLFPMADGESANAEIFWYQPKQRAIFDPENFHVPRRLARLLRNAKYTIRWNDDFSSIMRACGENRPDGHWINPVLIDSYTIWHREGGAFCLSVWDGDDCIGGIYGVLQGAVFMAESMFSRRSNGSSIALIVLVAGLVKAGVRMIDIQFINAHLLKFNPQELPHELYKKKLHEYGVCRVDLRADYFSLEEAISFVQSLTHTS